MFISIHLECPEGHRIASLADNRKSRDALILAMGVAMSHYSFPHRCPICASPSFKIADGADYATFEAATEDFSQITSRQLAAKRAKVARN